MEYRTKKDKPNRLNSPQHESGIHDIDLRELRPATVVQNWGAARVIHRGTFEVKDIERHPLSSQPMATRSVVQPALLLLGGA